MEKTKNRRNYLEEYNNIDLDRPDLVPNGFITALKSEELFQPYFAQVKLVSLFFDSRKYFNSFNWTIQTIIRIYN